MAGTVLPHLLLTPSFHDLVCDQFEDQQQLLFFIPVLFRQFFLSY